MTAGDSVGVIVSLRRDADDDFNGVPDVVSARNSGRKQEGWWVVIGNASANSLLSVKRLTFEKNSKVSKPFFRTSSAAYLLIVCMQVKLEFTAPEDPGDYNLSLFFMSDSYLGCDQEYEINLSVLASEDS